MSWQAVLSVAAGSALGGVVRYAVGVWLRGVAPSGIAVPTLLVNLVGSLLFGWLLARQASYPLPDALYLGLTTGVLGGFTTYSTFNTELLQHALNHDWAKLALYAATTLGACLLGGAGGWIVGRA